MSDYGIDNTEPVNIEVGRYALRTFKIVDGQLASIIQNGSHWKDGVCEAVCVKYKPGTDGEGVHAAPAAGCHCGVYGTLTLAALYRQYAQHACGIVAVIAAEGITFIGDVGLRTAAARVVSYWCSDELPLADQAVCAAQSGGARRFHDVTVMTRLYGLT